MNHSKHIFKIRDLVIKTLAATSLVITNPCSWLAEQRKLFPRANEPWSDREDLLLVKLALALWDIRLLRAVLSRDAIFFMSQTFARTPRAIWMRVEHILPGSFLFLENGGPRNA